MANVVLVVVVVVVVATISVSLLLYFSLSLRERACLKKDVRCGGVVFFFPFFLLSFWVALFEVFKREHRRFLFTKSKGSAGAGDPHVRRAIDRRRKEGRRTERDVRSRAEIVKGEKWKERESSITTQRDE